MFGICYCHPESFLSVYKDRYLYLCLHFFCDAKKKQITKLEKL